MNMIARQTRLPLLALIVLVSIGCISTGETIRVQGEVVNTAGQRVPDAVVIGEAAKRGGTLVRRSTVSDAEDEAREAVIKHHGDGTFTATSRWAGRLTLSIPGYKIRRVDDLNTEFLVPNQSFFQSADQVRLEVVKDE